MGFGLTYTIPVTQGGKPLGVLGVDLVLGDIQPWLHQAKPTEGTRLAILGSDGRLLVPPDQEETPGERSRVLKPEPLNPALHPIPAAIHLTRDADQAGRWPRVNVGGETYLVQRRRLHLDGGLDWELLAAIPEGDLLRESGTLLGPLLGALVSLKVQAPAEPLWIHGDRLQLEQVLLNLAVNGRDAMPRGGVLSLEAGCGPDGRPYLAVADDGQGIPPELREQLFMPFFTTKSADQGSGLGLAMVQGIARAHGADIDMESELGKGSRFILRFPPAQRAQPS